MTDFNAGDRVVVTALSHPDNSRGPRIGSLGTVVRGDVSDVLVQLDCPLAEGHSGEGLIPYGHGWWLSSAELAYAVPISKEQRIVNKIKQLDEKFKNRKSKNANNLPV